MKEINKKNTESSPLTENKKTWVTPTIELISHDVIRSGQAGFLSEAGNLGILPAVDYNS